MKLLAVADVNLAGARALVLIDHRLHGHQHGNVGELGMDPQAWLRWRMLARPQVLELDDLPVVPVVLAPVMPVMPGPSGGNE